MESAQRNAQSQKLRKLEQEQREAMRHSGVSEAQLYVDTRSPTCLPRAAEGGQEGGQDRSGGAPVHIRLPLSNMGKKSFVEKVGGYTVLTTAVNYASPLQKAMKRAMDIAGGVVGSLIALVVIAVAGPQIKRENPGPILFKQTRIGFLGSGSRFLSYERCT